MSRLLWIAATLSASLVAAAPLAAAGKIYKCKNAQGQIYYTQAFDAQHCAGGGAQLNKDGVAVKAIARQKTPEELAADKAAAEIAAQQEAARVQVELADRALTATFANEGELSNFFSEQLKGVDGEIQAAGSVLQSQHKILGQLLSAAADAERANKAIPPRVSENIAMVRSQMDEQRAHLKGRRARRVELEAERTAKIKRFRELTEEVAARRAASTP